MNCKEKWESICDKMKSYKLISEKELQFLIENIFEYGLDWQKSKGEIARPTIHFGSQNHGIPDVVLRKDGQNILCVELKKFMVGLKENNEKQLFSYMRALKLTFGILWGSSIRIFFDEPNDNQEPIKVCEIKFDSNNELGEKLVELLTKENFSTENFESFCRQQMSKNTTKTIAEQIEFLCSRQGANHIKELLLTEYPEEVVKNLVIDVMCGRPNNRVAVPDVKRHQHRDMIQNMPDDFSRNGMSIQNWIKCVLSGMWTRNLISDEEIKRLHDLEYCKQTFGIQFPLLCDAEEDIWYGTHTRYWTSWKLGNRYFVCSQWWKQLDKTYEYLINRWIAKIIAKSKEH